MADRTENFPVWDEERAQSMVGSRILIGITYISSTETRQEQMFGTIVSADSKGGFEVQLEGKRAGRTFWLPPHIEAFQKAPEGEYHLKETQEVVIDPDYTTMWTVNEPPTKQ